MSGYRATIGLEIHAELKTRTKMFCSCLNDPDEKEPNKNICAVCLAHPGALPVINKEAVCKVLVVGSAVGGRLADYAEFDRKNYFYPDIPKGYQISQYKYPLVSGGALQGITLTRIHLEEDTARSQHEGERSLVDYNRAGVPLMELVTDPVIHDAAAAGAFARELQLLLRALGAGEANMEKGEMRVEANVSVSGGEALGTKVEVKNLNSFRSVERAIAHEVARQEELLKKGKRVVQETRGWDEEKEVTFSQRKKESSHDYRYFPDPDLPALVLSEIPEFSPEALARALPELPWERRGRYEGLGLKPEEAELFARERSMGEFFDATIAGAPALARLAANYILSDIMGKREAGAVGESWLTEARNAQRVRSLLLLIERGALSSRGGKDTLALMFADAREPEAIARERGLLQQSDPEVLRAIARRVVEAHPSVVADYRAGKEAALQFLVGQGMKESKGSANPQELRNAIQTILA